MDDFIKIYDDAFSEEECEEIMFFIDKLDDCRQLGSSGIKKHLTDHKSFNASHNFHTTAGSWLGEKFLPKIAPCVNDYLETYSVFGEGKFLLYDVKAKKIPVGGGFHNWHFENSRVPYCTRQFVVQLYLNDDFSAGETEFLYMNKRIEAKTGRVIIFPAGFTHVHRGNPPIGGTKYIASSWGILQVCDDDELL
tara:strand:- start:254 stop:832 length:579 start_codon:yes stop_codon:yes gene_type:complete